MKRLAEQNQIEKIRFWGMICGTHSDYYIAEVGYAEFGEEALERKEEEELEKEKKLREDQDSDMDSEVDFLICQTL